jgi:hypothetical protein
MPSKAAPFRKPLQTLLAKKINAAPNKAPSSFLTLSVPGRSGLTNLRDRRCMSHELVSRLKDASGEIIGHGKIGETTFPRRDIMLKFLQATILLRIVACREIRKCEYALVPTGSRFPIRHI